MTIGLEIMAALSTAAGILFLIVAADPYRNQFTKLFFKHHTSLPRVGSMSDETWVRLNGIGLLVAAAILLVVRFVT